MLGAVSVDVNELGIVVIGRNEGQRLIDCLTSLKLHKGALVYVDSGSTDGSLAAAKDLGAFTVSLDMAQPFTAARARNEGFSALMALKPDVRLVQFIDGDCELVPSWLGTALAFIVERSDVAVLCGRRQERHPEHSVYNRLCDIEWNSPAGEALACGGDSLIRVYAFKEIGGFRPQLMAGEEPELCARLRQRGWKIWRLDADMTRHDAALTRFIQWWRRSVRSGYAEAEISCLHIGSNLASTELRRVARTLFWAALVPTIILIGALSEPVILFGLFVYPLQICRIAIRRGAIDKDSWFYAIFVMIAKFAQLQGFAQYLWTRWRNADSHPIEYK